MPTQTPESQTSTTGRVAVENILECLQAQGHSINWLAGKLGVPLEDLCIEMLMDSRLSVHTAAAAAAALRVPLFDLLIERAK